MVRILKIRVVEVVGNNDLNSKRNGKDFEIHGCQGCGKNELAIYYIWLSRKNKLNSRQRIWNLWLPRLWRKWTNILHVFWNSWLSRLWQTYYIGYYMFFWNSWLSRLCQISNDKWVIIYLCKYTKLLFSRYFLNTWLPGL